MQGCPAARRDRARTSKGMPMASQARPAKTIGILTSGGDCSGLNAAIRAVVCRAIECHGWRVLGIRQGTMGLLRRPVEFEELGLRIVTTNILRMGGTILGTTNKGDPFAFPMSDGSVRDRSDEVIAGYRELGLDALIGIGGDGSFSSAFPRRSTTMSAPPRTRSASNPPSPSPPRRSTGCSRRRQVTTG